MIDRIIARGLDLMLMGMIFVAVWLPPTLAIAVAGLQRMLEPGADDGLDGFIFVAVVAAMSALAWEPVRQWSKGRTWGRNTADVQLRDFTHPAQTASSRQVLVRYAVSAAACGTAIGLSFAAAAAMGISLTFWRAAGLTTIPSGFVWLLALLSALLRADRRGWHDMAAGTVLVSTFTFPTTQEPTDPADGAI